MMAGLLFVYFVGLVGFPLVVILCVGSKIDNGERLDAYDRFFRDHPFPTMLLWPVMMFLWSGSRFRRALHDLHRQRQRRLRRAERHVLYGRKRRSDGRALRQFDQQLAAAQAKKIVTETTRTKKRKTVL